MDTTKTKYLKPKDVAKLLQLNILTIYEYIRKGKLRAVRFGKSYRIEEMDLESFIKGNIVKIYKNI